MSLGEARFRQAGLGRAGQAVFDRMNKDDWRRAIIVEM